MSDDDAAAYPPDSTQPDVPTAPVVPTTPATPAPFAAGPPPSAPTGPPLGPPTGPPPGPPTGPPPAPPVLARPGRPPRRTLIAALALACFLTVSGFIGYTLGNNRGSSSANTSSIAVVPSMQGSQLPSMGQQNGNSNTNNGNFDASGIANSVNPSVVNINTTLSGGEAAGTGIILSSDGLVLTNNHVIAESNSVSVTIGGDDNNRHSAKVLGYDVADDVALIQVEGVSGLHAASLGAASTLSVGDQIVAIGNAGGQGGTPSAVTGNVTALNQQITASDQDGSNPETLSGLVKVDADIQPGDSGGPLVDANGKVVGMDAAASSSGGGYGFGGRFGGGSSASSSEGYAIPIEHAVSIAKKIASGDGGTNIHIGGSRGILGVEVQDAGATNLGNGGFGGGQSGDGSSGGTTPGANVVGVQSGSGAESAGIAQGDVIVSIDGKTVNSAADLTHAIVAFAPKDKVDVKWIDSSGTSHQASVALSSGPPA